VSSVNVADGLHTVKDVADIALACVQILAVIVAGIWTYLRFIRGRVYYLRADVKVSCDLLSAGANDKALRIRVAVTNVGDSNITLTQESSRVFVTFLPAAMAMSAVSSTRLDAWQPLPGGNVGMLSEQADLEAREAVRDEILVPLPPAASSGYPRAYRITATIAAPAKKNRRQVWLDRCVVTTDWT
jgi:hypothetical protein